METVFGRARGVARRRKRRIHSQMMMIPGKSLSVSDRERFVNFLHYFSDSMRSNTQDVEEYIVTGSVDTCINVWEQEDSGLKKKESFQGHSLGVVSVAVSADGTSKQYRNCKQLLQSKDRLIDFLVFRVCV